MQVLTVGVVTSLVLLLVLRPRARKARMAPSNNQKSMAAKVPVIGLAIARF